MHPAILCIETATAACSVALRMHGDNISCTQSSENKHSSIILDMIAKILSEGEIHGTQLDAIACGVGPGGFTGIRIAVGITQGLAWAWNKPVVAISTLATLAQGFADQHTHICPALDARMGEINWGLYHRNHAGVMYALQPDTLSRASAVYLPDDLVTAWQAVGNGWQAHQQSIKARFSKHWNLLDDEALPEAAAMGILAEKAWEEKKLLTAAELVPVYLRDTVAQKSQTPATP